MIVCPRSQRSSACFSTLKGPRCSEPCSDGLWGRHCNQTCFKHCPNSDTCQRETGACVCRPGYWGITCQNSECSCRSASGEEWPDVTGFTVSSSPHSQNAERGLTATSAACRALPAASHTAATMWRGSATACQGTRAPTVIKVSMNLHQTSQYQYDLL